MLDFVPNHVAVGHRFAREQPHLLVRGTASDLASAPQNFVRAGEHIFAHGRDPYFPGWADTLQLDYRRPEVHAVMTDALLAVAARSDGVRCDMAMLLLPEIFAKTWGADREVPDFWGTAIPKLRARQPRFVLMAEVYWDLEWTLQQKGFDFTYDKRLYDRLRDQRAEPVRLHLMADPSFSSRCVRFLENHDEPRAAAAFPPDVHRAAAALAFFAPGMAFFHDGQLEGRRLHANLHLMRRAAEPVDPETAAFYRSLCSLGIHRHGDATILPAGHPSLIALRRGSIVLVVNYSGARAEGLVDLGEPIEPILASGGGRHAFGLHVDLEPWAFRTFVTDGT
jgi:hypothetical protein